ncbi:hypothetical protein [Rhodoferax sp. TS-BS-61-7]|uniref:hypothetical protein n=1 Tax=Rhodoferax sp. TS-BS-61-7 TaxID=2094194 RepID=UPI001374C317|nr:hypothetical protein [Rhodoferax sp. TS-BS-61-7]
MTETETPPPATREWPALAQSYHAHHFNCPVCIAAGTGYGQRCQAGALLWTAYQESVA